MDSHRNNFFHAASHGELHPKRLKFINQQLGKRPVVAVIYSHSHGDHFGGARGIVDEKDVKSGKVKIIAPEGFMKHAIAENGYAGTAMTRRMFYQYGVLLPASPYGHIGQAIGKNTATENIVATIHNIYTLRGALVRDALKWSKEINAAIYKIDPNIDTMIASHSWPRWGQSGLWK